MRLRRVIHNSVVSALSLLAVGLLALNAFGFPEVCWYRRDATGFAVERTLVGARGGELYVLVVTGFLSIADLDRAMARAPWQNLDWRPIFGFGMFGSYLITKFEDSGPGLYLLGKGYSVSLWPLIIVTGGYPFTLLIRGPMRRYKRRRLGLCLTCGYDLTGNESGRCPECGVEISRSPEAAETDH